MTAKTKPHGRDRQLNLSARNRAMSRAHWVASAVATAAFAGMPEARKSRRQKKRGSND